MSRQYLSSLYPSLNPSLRGYLHGFYVKLSETPTRQAAGHLRRSLKELRRPLLYVSMMLIYFSITSRVIRSPTVRAKYPSSQISPDQSFFFRRGNSRNNSLALMLFIILTTSPIERVAETIPGYAHDPTSISSISNPVLLRRSLDQLFRSLPHPLHPSNIFFRYFGHHTRW